jgi:serine/threonine-protein kinase
VHDFGEIDGVLFIDMRLVEGPSVKAELGATGGLVPARAVSIIGQVAAALDAAHASGLVHRDIKPENVLLTTDDFAYLVDFGIANGGGEATVTRTGLIIGSCAYMAPERLNGEPGGPPSDVYSLTCLLFECLTGRPPFEAEDIRQIMSAHMFAPPPRPSEMRHGISPAFDDVVARGMAKNPTERFASAGELARAAAAAVHGRSAAGPSHHTRHFPAERPRPPAPVAAASVNHSRFSRTQWALLAGTIGLFAVAAVLAVAIVFVGDSSTSGPASTLAAPPPSTTSTTSPTPTTMTSTTPTTSAAPISGVSGTDAQGFIGHAARCDAGSSLTAAIRTSSSLAVICQTASGSYYYHGERLRDGANVELTGAVPTDGGFDATNPADGARYQVRPDELTILSNGHVDSAERALEYGSAD